MALKLCTFLKVLSYVAMSELEVYPETYPSITSVSYAS